MSHTVTVTRTTTSSTSAIIINTGYLKTLPGILKLLEVVISAVCLGILAYYRVRYYPVAEDFFLCASTTTLVASFCLLTACLVSLSTGTIISKTIYELVYHFVAFALILASSITLLVQLNRYSSRYAHYDAYLAASILGLILAALFLISTIFACRTYRGL